MAFSILNKRMLENDSVKEILSRVEWYEAIFTKDQQKSFDIHKSLAACLILQDYDEVKKIGTEYDINKKEYVDDFYVDFYKCGDILPIIKFEEIKESSQVISEDDDTLTIQYGSGLTSRVSTSDDLRKIKMDSMMGDIVETNRKITIRLLRDGKKTQLRVYKNQQTGEEYVFMKKNYDDSFDDSLDPHATFVGVVSPLTWTVDKKTGFAICSKPLFLSETIDCEYDKSELAKFLKSDEFVKELGVHQEKKQEKSTSVNNPFGEKKRKLSVEQQIRRTLMGGKRIPYLVGHPGVGKTQIAKSINKNCLVCNVATFTPDAFTGKTSNIQDKIITHEGDKTIERSVNGRTVITEPEWHTKLVEMSNRCRQNNERCVLLLDEFDKLTPTMQTFVNGIANDPRTIAEWEIPDNVDLIFAGNTEEYSDASFDISGEVASRLIKIEVLADDIDWLKWASKHDIDPIVRAYIHNFPNKIIQDVKDENGNYDYGLSLTPRSWDQKISEELKASRKIHEFPYLDRCMDEKNRKEFEEFISLYIELGIEGILKGNIPADIFDLTHDKIQIIINCLIATATTEEEVINALTFIRQHNLSEYQALFEKRWIEINSTDEDILKLKLAKSSLGDRRTGYGK